MTGGTYQANCKHYTVLLMNVSTKAVKHLEERSDNFMRVSPLDVGHCAVPCEIQYLGRDTWVVLY